MKNNKTTKIYSILLLISILIAGLSNGFTFAAESLQSNFTETYDSKCITGEEIFEKVKFEDYIILTDDDFYEYFRGDSHLFWEVEETFKSNKFSSYEEFEKLFNKKFEEITKKDVQSVKKDFKRIYVEKYDFGGLSGGVVTPHFWFEVFLPCVKNICFDKFSYNDNSNAKNQNSKQIKICINNIYFSLDPKKYKATVLGRENKNDTKLRIPAFLKYNGMIYRVTEVAKKAFYGDWHLLTLSFDGHINKIGDAAFDRNYLVFIDMHKGVDGFGKDAFLRIPCFARFIVPEGKEEEYANKLGKNLKGVENRYTCSGEERFEYDLFIGTNSKEVAEEYNI